MKYINKTLRNLKLFFLYIIFPVILSITVFYVYQDIFGTINLCDDNDFILSQLKLELKNEKDKFNHSIINKEIYWTLYQEFLNKPLFHKDHETEEYILKNITSSREAMNESLEKINSIEKSIKRIDPNFKSLNYNPCIGNFLGKLNNTK